MITSAGALAVGGGVTVACFLAAQRLQSALGMHPAVNPVLVGAGAVVALGVALDLPADAYRPTAALFGWLLGPHVVLLAVPLYRFRGEIAAAAWIVLPAVAAGDVDAVLCMAFTVVAGIATYLAAEKPVIDLRTARRRRGPTTPLSADGPRVGDPAAALIQPAHRQPSPLQGRRPMFIAQLPLKRALAAFTVAAVLAVGTSLFHRPAPEAGPLEIADAREPQARCEGGRGRCGDRSDDEAMSALVAGNAPPAFNHCLGGRRACGDRAATASAFVAGSTPTAGDPATHPRALAR